jgi:hypothetical protein
LQEVSVVVRFRDQTRANASVAVTLWALVMTVVLVLDVVAPSARVTTVGFVVTALLGASLGWRRRFGAVFYAPIVSWLFAWFPLMIASMVHDGILKGFFDGLLLISVGWIGIGFVEFVWLAMVTIVVRALRGGRNDAEPVVVIDPPH